MSASTARTAAAVTPRSASWAASPGTQGLVLALASAAAFGTSGIFASSLLTAGWTPGAAVLLRMAGASLLLAPVAVVQLRGRWHLLWRSRWRTLAFGVFAIAGCQLGFFASVETVPVSLALLIEYAGVLLVVAWAWTAGGQRPRLRTAVGGVAALAGLALVLGVGGTGPAAGAGLLWAAFAAGCLALYFVIAARPDDGVPALATAWVGMTVGAVVLGLASLVGALPMAATGGDVLLAGTSVPWWVPLTGVVLLATTFSYSTGIAAARHLSAAPASFVALTEVLFAGCWAWLALGQQLTPVQLLGAAVVLAGIVVVRSDTSAAA